MDGLSENDYDHLCKVVLVGDVSVGKTHLLSRYMKDALPKNPSATIGVEFATRTVQLPRGGVVRAQIWDTCGQEKYRSITRAHYRRASGALVVYDITRQASFQSCARWVTDIREGASPDAVIMLVGNKADLVDQDSSVRQVHPEMAAAFAKQHGLLFSEASAVASSNVQLAFERLFEEIYARAPKTAGADKSGSLGGIRMTASCSGSNADTGGPTGCDTAAC